jgi:hypothetical protein
MQSELWLKTVNAALLPINSKQSLLKCQILMHTLWS